MMKLYKTADYTALIVLEDTDRSVFRVVDWDLSDDEIDALVAKAASGTLTDADAAEPVSSTVWDKPWDAQEDWERDPRQGRCDWVHGDPRSAFRASLILL